MKKYQDLMIDLETLGQTPSTPVISLGAAFFDIEAKEVGPTFYATLDVGEQMKYGRMPDASTLKWWMRQSGAAKKVFSEQAKPVTEVLNLFNEWVKANGKKVNPWGNGSSFDISIMENLYRQYNIKIPWLFYNVMDVRTFKRFCANGKKLEKGGVNHNALDDAVSQAKYIIENS